jgi:hypothetical protein
MSAAITPQVVEPVEFIPICDYEFLGDGRTVENKCTFVEWYRRKASIFHAAQAARIARSTVYKWMEEDEQFASAVHDSFEDAADVMETSTYEEALGVNGKPGNALLKMFWLKAHRPKYRDKVTVDIEGLNEEIRERMKHLGTEKIPAQIAQSLHFLPPSPDQQKEEKSK